MVVDGSNNIFCSVRLFNWFGEGKPNVARTMNLGFNHENPWKKRETNLNLLKNKKRKIG